MQRYLAIPLLLLHLGNPASAQQPDPHAIYEQKCGGCHEDHAGDFAFARLEVIQDTLLIKNSDTGLLEFLNSGHGSLAAAQTKVLSDFLLAVRKSEKLFDSKCGICHERAKNFARLELVIHNGQLMGRYTERDIGAFLKKHGRLDPEEVSTIIEMLKRQILTKPYGFE